MSTAAMAEVLRLDGVWSAFDRGWVLEDVSLSVAAGEIVAVIGGGGQGKTTLVRLATGTLPVDRGRVLVDGADVARLKDRDLSHMLASDIGIAIGVGPSVGLTVRDYIETAVAAPKDHVWRWRWRRRWGRREQQRMTSAVLEEFGISECADRQWEALSDWQRVLVELAQAVIVRPRLVLIDDLAGRFDLRQKQTLMDMLEAVVRERGCGVLMAVSDDASALRAVRVWRLHRRRLRLMADHPVAEPAAEVIPLRRQRLTEGDPSSAEQEQC
jgi:ABC-type cobalamin/Fe3+-siderophores transport system ATPase subunit